MKPSSYWEPPWTWTVGFPGSPALGPRADGDASKVAGWMVACDSPNIPKVWGFHIGNLTHHQNLLIQGRVLDQEWRTLDSSNANGGIMGKHVGKHQMISTKGRLQVVWKQHVHQPQQQQGIPNPRSKCIGCFKLLNQGYLQIRVANRFQLIWFVNILQIQKPFFLIKSKCHWSSAWGWSSIPGESGDINRPHGRPRPVGKDHGSMHGPQNWPWLSGSWLLPYW